MIRFKASYYIKFSSKNLIAYYAFTSWLRKNLFKLFPILGYQ